MGHVKTFDVSMLVPEAVSLIGERIASQRLGLNWTQKELAAKAGISLRTLIRLENGEGNPALSALVAVCSALNLLNRFETLLPRVELTPEQILKGRPPRERARKSKSKSAWKWGDER